MGSKKGIPRGKYKTKNLQPDGDVFCASCNKPYKKKSSLLQHIRATHLNIRLTCFCSKKFISPSILNRHQKNVHDVNAKISTPRKYHTGPLTKTIRPSFEASDAFPSLAKVLSMKQNKKFGIHIVANENIDAGQTVLIAPPFACAEYLVNTGEGCFQCNKRSKTRIRCDHCIDVWFCSHLCKAGQAHRKRCDRTFINDDGPKVRLVAKIISTVLNAFGDVSTLFDFCREVLCSDKKTQQCRPPFSLYGEILKLTEDVDPNHAKIARRVVKIMLQKPSFEEFSRQQTEALKRDLFVVSYHHANILDIYGFSEQIVCRWCFCSILHTRHNKQVQPLMRTEC